MWNLKCNVLNNDSIYTVLTNKYKVIDYFYPLDHYVKGSKVYIFGVHIIEGLDKEKKGFINALKRHKKVRKFIDNDNHFITLIAEEEPFYKLMYSSELYHPSPVVIREGREYWNIASWNRKLLENLMREFERWKDKFSDFKLQLLQKSNLKEIYFPKVMPELPEKQKQAFRLALKHGYYTWPRKSDLTKLAENAGVSVSTFQEHLRKAEARLLPFFAEHIDLS